MPNVELIRNAISRRIAENPAVIVVYTRPLKDNGFGIMVPNMLIAPVEETLGTAVISRRRLPDVIKTNPKTPYDYQDVYYLIAEHDATWLRQGLAFMYNGERFRTLRPEKRIIFGAVAYILVDLEQTTSEDVGAFYG